MYDIFDEVLKVFRNMKSGYGNGIDLTFTPKNVAFGDHFLIFSAYKSCTCHFWETRSGLIYVDFDGDEPMLLENCPDTFYESIIKVAKENGLI